MRQSLSTGLSRTLDLTFTFTRGTRPFLSRNTSTTLPSGHELRCEHSTAKSTTCPTAMFLLGRSHFCLLWRRGMYSFHHLFQKISAGYWTCLHLLQDSRSSLRKRPGGIGDWDRSSNKWLGVSGSCSHGSLETLVIGWSFIILSTSPSKVVRPSSSIICSRRRACKIFLVLRMQRSHTLP